MIILLWPSRTAVFHQHAFTRTFSDMLSNYPSSMRCPTKLEITNPSDFTFYCVTSTYTSTNYFLTIFYKKICPTVAIYWTKFYPVFHPNTLNKSMSVSLNPYLTNMWTVTTSCPNLKPTLTTKTNSNFRYWWYSSYLSSVAFTNQSQLLVYDTGLTISLSRTPNTRFDHQPANGAKLNKIIMTNFLTLGWSTKLWQVTDSGELFSEVCTKQTKNILLYSLQCNCLCI